MLAGNGLTRAILQSFSDELRDACSYYSLGTRLLTGSKMAVNEAVASASDSRPSRMRSDRCQNCGSG